jgi:hypothetical protein
MPAAHPPEFRRRALDLVRLGEKPVAAIAKDLGISESCCGTGWPPTMSRPASGRPDLR